MDGAHHVVALPYPGRGHVNAMMNLCDLLLSRAGGRLLVTFVVTEEWLGLLGPAASSSPPPPPPLPRLPPGGIRFRTIPNVIPSELNRGADFAGFIEAVYTRMEAPFEELLGRLQEEGGELPPAEGIISDTYMPWAVTVGDRMGVPVYSLFTMSASFFWVLRHFHLVASHGAPPGPIGSSSEKGDESLACIPAPGITSLKAADFQSGRYAEKPLKIALEAVSWVNKAQCLLFTSFYELEPQALDALKAELPLPVYHVGPCVPYMALQDEAAAPVNDNGSAAGGYCTWLDSQPRSSVLYVSLGSFLSVSDKQMDEIARGLRDSNVRFMWVARRDASRLRGLAGGMGLVVPWCDQLRVLCHPAVGGFLTHCGWNSTLEAVFAGVPALTFPIFWDQPPDSRVITEEWRTGLSLKGEATGGVVVGREQISERVKRLMDLEGEESKELRGRAGELKGACRRAVEAGGSSTASLDAFIEQVARGNTG